MRIISWNINSIRLRMDLLRSLISKYSPDLLLLQEIKCRNEDFPYDHLSDLNYNFYVHGQKGFNGVAVLSKFICDDIFLTFPSNPCSEQSRFIEINVQTPIGYISVISLYAPNGGEVNSDKFELKLEFFKTLNAYLINQKLLGIKTIIGGDFNIAPFNIDVYSPELLNGTTCFTIDERALLRTLLNSGFDDVFRVLNPKKQEFSWWDYRGRSVEYDKGMRIDFIMTSSNITSCIKNAYIDSEFRKLPKPSDHTPVIVEAAI